MNSQEVVIPAEAGIQDMHNWLKALDSGFRRNDGFGTFDEFVIFNE